MLTTSVAPPRLRIASVPAAHPYVRNLGLPVEHLPDPVPRGARPGQWWPPVMLRPEWIAAHADRFDLMHLHFGLETVTPAALAEGLDALRRAGRPLVFTVHDLEHPQLSGRDAFRDHLDVVLARADGVIALTEGSARAVARGWGRSARVVPHPHMHPLRLPLPRRAPSSVVGMHLGDLRPSVDGPRAVRTLARAVCGLPGTTARVWMRDRVRDPAARAAVRACAGVELVETGRVGDAQLAAALAEVDAVVLPHAHGTHSGWIELCWDLGVPVVAPEVGYFAEQHPVDAFRWGEAGSLRDALQRALRRPPADAAARRAERRRLRTTIAERHLELYRAVLAGSSPRHGNLTARARAGHRLPAPSGSNPPPRTPAASPPSASVPTSRGSAAR